MGSHARTRPAATGRPPALGAPARCPVSPGDRSEQDGGCPCFGGGHRPSPWPRSTAARRPRPARRTSPDAPLRPTSGSRRRGPSSSLLSEGPFERAAQRKRAGPRATRTHPGFGYVLLVPAPGPDEPRDLPATQRLLGLATTLVPDRSGRSVSHRAAEDRSRPEGPEEGSRNLGWFPDDLEPMRVLSMSQVLKR